jgi:hypothetical protein
MAKKKNAVEQVASVLAGMEVTYANGTHGLLDEGMAVARRHAQDHQLFDGQVLSADETIAQLICLPMPALSLRFLMHGDGWPLSRFFLINGFKESCKSAFMAEVGRWHRRMGGYYLIIETEQKDGAGLRDSIFDYDREAWTFTRVASQDAWNKAYFFWVDRVRGMMDGYDRELTEAEVKAAAKKAAKAVEEEGTAIKVKKAWGKEKKPASKVHVPGIGRTSPVCIAVDSISAVLSEKQSDEMLESGIPTLHHPVNARLLSDFFKVAPKQLAGYPISFMAVSHLRESKAPNSYQTIRSTTGGEAPKYQMTTEIEMYRVKTGQERHVHSVYGEIDSIPLQMIIHKNSLAPKEYINVSMCWYKDPDDLDPMTRQRRQKTYFDWHSSSIELLLDCMRTGDSGKGFSAKRAKALRELIDIHAEGDKKTAWSKTLGISSDDRLPWLQAGRILEQKIQTDTEFRLALYDILDIRQRRLFKYAVDMQDQINEYHGEIVASEASAATRISSEASPDVPLPPEVVEGEEDAS